MERYSSMSRYRSATTRTFVHQATNKPVVRRSSVIVLTHLQPASPRKAQSQGHVARRGQVRYGAQDEWRTVQLVWVLTLGAAGRAGGTADLIRPCSRRPGGRGALDLADDERLASATWALWCVARQRHGPTVLAV